MRDPSIDELAERLAQVLEPDALLNSRECAAKFRCSMRHFNGVILKLEGFPPSQQFNDKPGSRRYWLKSDVSDFIRERYQPAKSSKGGRPRKRRFVV